MKKNPNNSKAVLPELTVVCTETDGPCRVYLNKKAMEFFGNANRLYFAQRSDGAITISTHGRVKPAFIMDVMLGSAVTYSKSAAQLFKPLFNNPSEYEVISIGGWQAESDDCLVYDPKVSTEDEVKR